MIEPGRLLLLAEEEHIEVRMVGDDFTRVFVWHHDGALRVSVVGPVWPQLDVRKDGVTVLEEEEDA